MFEAHFQTFEDESERAESAGPGGGLARRNSPAAGSTASSCARADRQQNEYLPASEERLAWLTGFTGSAGSAIVLADRAAIFVDGRYTVQAGAQVDRAIFSIEHLVESPPDQWLEANLKPGAKLGYDPWLHTSEGAERLRKACANGRRRTGGGRRQSDRRLVDRPAGAAVRAGQAARHQIRRRKRRRQSYAASKARSARSRADLLVVSDPQNVAWAFNIRGGDIAHTPLALAFATVPRQGKPALYVEAAKLDNAVRAALADIADLRTPDDLARDLAQTSGKTVRLDQATAADALTRLVSEHGGKPARGPDPITLMKAVKNHAEITGSREAHKRDGAALVRFLAWFAREAPTGKLTEIDAVAALESFRRDTGLLKDVSFPTIAGAGPNGAIVHYRVTRESNRTIGMNELFLIDSGAQYEDGTTDVTRTIAVGTPTDEMRDRFTRVLKGHIAIATAEFPENTSGAQLDPLARLALWQAGNRLRPRHRPRRRQLSLGARGAGAHLQARPCGLAARHDPFERAGLLQDRGLRHPHREPGAGDRRARAGRRREAAQRLRDADAGADRPHADQHPHADVEGAALARQLPCARAGGDRAAARRADAGLAGAGDQAGVKACAAISADIAGAFVHDIKTKTRAGAAPNWRLLTLLIAMTAIGPATLNILVPALPGLADAAGRPTPAPCNSRCRFISSVLPARSSCSGPCRTASGGGRWCWRGCR